MSESILEKLHDILDLLRTSTPPEVYGMTIDEWNKYKVGRCANKLETVIYQLEGKEDAE